MGLFGTGKQERAAFEAAAAGLGLAYDEKDPTGVGTGDHFLLPGGQAAGALNVVHGALDGGPVRLFEYVAVGPPDPMRELAGIPGTGSRKTELTGGLATLPAPTPWVVLYRGQAKGFTPQPTGHPGLDAAFSCRTRRTGAAAALDDEPFAAAVLASPADCSVELSNRDLLVVCGRRPPEQLAGLARFLVGLRAVVPSALYALAAPAD